MKHLTAPFMCVLAVGFFAALLVRAIQTNAYSFVVFGIAGSIAFSILCWMETRKAWPAFRRAMERRKQMRIAPPFTRIKLQKEDLH